MSEIVAEASADGESDALAASTGPVSETVVVDDATSSAGDRTPTGEEAAPSQAAPFEWDRESLTALGRQWYEPLVQPEGWLAVAYLAVGVVSGPVFFTLALAFAAVAFGLSFVVVGLLLVVPWFSMIAAFADAERRMARWIGIEIERRPVAPPSGVWLSAIGRLWSDPGRWRQVGFVAANVVVAPVLYSIGVLPFAIVGEAVFGTDILPIGSLDVSGGGLLVALPIVALMLAAGPRWAIWVAHRKAEVTSWFLGPDRLAAAEERVSALTGQRDEILDAVARERRRIERNLHDGVQQQLVAIGLDLGMAANAIERDPARARELVIQARNKVQGSIGELRQLGRGLHPAILEDRGIDAALSAVVADAPIPISVHVEPDRDLETDVAEIIYFVVNEAVANVLKHARARVASVSVISVGDKVRVTVHDDGLGGADPFSGTGLAGIRARVVGVDGTLSITSPAGGPTTLTAEVPRHG